MSSVGDTFEGAKGFHRDRGTALSGTGGYVRRQRAQQAPCDDAGGRFRYHPCMSKLLLNLRGVPDDEADDVRRFLGAARIHYYETQPTRWGTAGCIWVDDADVAEAKRLMAEYQRERLARARAELDEAKRNGTASTFIDVLRTQPLRVALAVIGTALLLGLMAVPVLLLSK